MRINALKSLLPLLLVALGGGLLTLLFIVQLGSSLNTLDENMRLAEHIARKTLLSEWEKRLKSVNSQSLGSASWKTLPPSMYYYKNGERLFPYVINNQIPSETNYTIVPEHKVIINNIKKSLGQKNETALKNDLAEFLHYKMTYKHHPTEEVIAWLRVIEAPGKTEWSREFVQQSLFDGWTLDNVYIPSVADLIFSNSNVLSLVFVQELQSRIAKLVSAYGLQNEQYDLHYDTLISSEEIPEPSDMGFWVSKSNWIIYKTQKGEFVAVPIDLTKARESLFETLISLKILAKTDHVSIGLNDSQTRFEDIEISLQRALYNKKYSNEIVYFIAKLSILMLLVLFILLYFNIRKNESKRKEQYQSLQNDFVSLVSHEVRTPLSAIALMAETIEKRSNRDLPINDYPRRIHDETTKFQSLLDNMLAISQVSNSGNLSTASLGLADALIDIANEYPKVNRRIDVPNSVKINTNPTLFSLVIKNLMSNAIKYNERKEIVIDIEYEPEDQRIIFRDNGIGISQPQWRDVFERFNRNHNKVDRQGLGIGLSLSRDIMRKLGGDLFISDSCKDGTTWIVCL